MILGSLAQLRAMRGEFEQARELIRPARSQLDDLGLVVLAAATAIDASRGAARGRPGDRRGELRRAEETLTALGERTFRRPSAVVCSPRSSTRGTGEGGRADHGAGPELGRPEDVSRRPSGDPYGPRCWPAGAVDEEAERLARDGRPADGRPTPGMQADALIDLAEVLRRAARPDEARAAVAEAGLYEIKGTRRPPPGGRRRRGRRSVLRMPTRRQLGSGPARHTTPRGHRRMSAGLRPAVRAYASDGRRRQARRAGAVGDRASRPCTRSGSSCRRGLVKPSWSGDAGDCVVTGDVVGDGDVRPPSWHVAPWPEASDPEAAGLSCNVTGNATTAPDPLGPVERRGGDQWVGGTEPARGGDSRRRS